MHKKKLAENKLAVQIKKKEEEVVIGFSVPSFCVY
jgi:hypothetical protein